VRRGGGRAEVVLAAAAVRAGPEVRQAQRAATWLLVAADVNAVPPAGIEDVMGVMDGGKPLPGSQAVGIRRAGWRAISSIRCIRLLERMRTGKSPSCWQAFPGVPAPAGEVLPSRR
jgi:methylene-tetrahydromethanopterin dehydrogenase